MNTTPNPILNAPPVVCPTGIINSPTPASPVKVEPILNANLDTNLTAEQLGEELAKRQTVYMRKPRTILVKLAGTAPDSWGFPEIPVPTPNAKDAQHKKLAEKKGLNPHAIRKHAVDTGYPAILGDWISLEYLEHELEKLGVGFAGGHVETWVNHKKEKCSRIVIKFEEGANGLLPLDIQKLLYNDAHQVWVYANMNYEDKEKMEGPQHRADTINISGQRPLTANERLPRLVVVRNHYDTQA